ncbi:tetratricopeptide repeat-containing diguanylate cyclase [Rheinheimera sp. SA_1]|uniref:tetratricopeptide repeat-containing diguanylate cyclase n=1 Tax=Rheinheimera sp. SA_1 TaxID=1827365 RepID=UPI0018D30D4C|nr:GGDEF domain-containing protein [Rheinheimera sp. SA_1]
MRKIWLWFRQRFIQGTVPVLLLWLSLGTAHAVPEVDARLEAELEQYLQLTSSDLKAAAALLQKVAPQITALTPAATKVRFNSYLSSQLSSEKNYPAADLLLQENWQIAEQQQDPDIWAEVLAEHLQQYWSRGESAKAVSYLEPLLQYAPKATQNRIRYFAWNTAASFQSWQGKYELALASFHQAYASIERDENPRTPFRKMYLKASIANLHGSLRNYPLAIKTIEEGLKESKNNPDLAGYVTDFYIQEGYILVDVGELEAALNSYQQGLASARKLNNPYTEAILQNNIGDIYLRQRKLDLAASYFEQSLAFGISKQDKPTIALSTFNLGYVQVLQGNYEKGIAQMQAMIKEFGTLGGKADLMAYLLELADAHRFAGQHQAEADVLRQYNQLSSEIFQKDREKQLNQLQEEFSAKEKTKEIAALTQQNQLNAIEIERQNLQQKVTMLIGIVVVLASCLLFLLYRKVRQANLKLKEANDKLAYQSLRDPLTGLFNRRSLLEHMERRQQSDRRVAAPQLTDGFILLDIDFFKHINDHYGHAAGDAVLVEIAKRLTTLTRTDDMVWRWGGEEFLILLRRVDMTALTNFTQRVLDVIGSSSITFGKQQLQVTASAGFLTYPFAGLDEQTLNWPKALQLADMALYLGKVHGRNRAYGLLGLNQPYQDIAAKLETDLSLAIEQGLVDVVLVEGPAKEQRH